MRITRIAFLLLSAAFFIVSCGGGGGGGVVSAASPVATGDSVVVSTGLVNDFGYIGEFEMTFQYPDYSAASGTVLVHGQVEPNREWIFYTPEQLGGGRVRLTLAWPKGEAFESSLLTEDAAGRQYADLSSSMFAVGGPDPNDLHLRVVLGVKDVCPEFTSGDTFIKNSVDLGGGVRRVWLDYTRLPIRDYTRLVFWAQTSPNGPWSDTEYQVVDAHPCYFVDIAWTENSAIHGTMCVDKADGSRECIDASGSGFSCEDHLCLFGEGFEQEISGGGDDQGGDDPPGDDNGGGGIDDPPGDDNGGLNAAMSALMVSAGINSSASDASGDGKIGIEEAIYYLRKAAE